MAPRKKPAPKKPMPKPTPKPGKPAPFAPVKNQSFTPRKED